DPAKSLHLFRSCPAISQQVAPRRGSEAASSRRVARVRSDPAASTHKNPHSASRAGQGGEGNPIRIVAGDVAGVSDQEGRESHPMPTARGSIRFACPPTPRPTRPTLDPVIQVRILEGQLTAELTARDPLKATQGVVMIGRRSIACPTRSS